MEKSKSLDKVGEYPKRGNIHSEVWNNITSPVSPGGRATGRKLGVERTEKKNELEKRRGKTATGMSART